MCGLRLTRFGMVALDMPRLANPRIRQGTRPSPCRSMTVSWTECAPDDDHMKDSRGPYSTSTPLSDASLV
jgi:hypothetical protein